MKTNFFKSVLVLITLTFFLSTAYAQSPEKMSYQAVIRNSSDALVTNTQIGMEINIRQGSETGAVVYSETQTPTTNANGLVSIEIGGGTGFNTIDWASDEYFIETKTAIVPPLTTYTITGISQLLSVPYALHAKTAETIAGGITETDPVFVASPANGILSGDISNWNSAYVWGNHATAGYLTSFTETDPLWTASPSFGITNTNVSNWNTAFGWGNHATAGYLTSFTETDPAFTAWDKDYDDLTNKPTIPTAADGSETKVTAGTNVTVTGSGTTANPYLVGTTDTLAIGDSYQGGIIFWLDATGQHGLIAATVDQSTGIQWYNGTATVTNAVRDGIYAGMYNTERIIANQGVGSYAAQLCANYQGGGYGDWYLPSKYELDLLCQKKTAVGGFANEYYWSSTESNLNFARMQFFLTDVQSILNKSSTGYVRAVRAF
jgi:hypothetical protein